MEVQGWILCIFVFAWGCCIGSFLNVVIYRLPREKSIVTPPSACPACGKHIQFYDNIPLISWLVLGRRCRYCKAPISPRYFTIELLTGLTFLGLFILYFHTNVRTSVPELFKGGWLVYLLHIATLAAFIAASTIDLELWIIPLSICWFVMAVGLIGSIVGGYVIDPELISAQGIIPSATASIGALAAGATVGMVISMLLLITGLVKRSYESEDDGDDANNVDLSGQPPQFDDENFNHRLEALREIVFLLPIIVLSLGAYWLNKNFEPVANWWYKIIQIPAVSGFLGSLFGYFVGCGVVWVIRIFGTLAFGKEAMGLGDVHLMGAAGAVIGPFPVVLAFFIAPFFGLMWAGINMFSKKIRQIPYGPFLSFGVLVVMILYDWIRENLFVHYY